MTDTTAMLASLLADAFTYDAETGVVRWKKAAQRSDLSGTQAGTLDSKGRLRVAFNGRTVAVHHIAFALHYGRLPVGQVDHINHNKTDNRAVNLREASNAENSRNRKNARPPKSGRKGVSLHKGRYIARIMKDGRPINLGSFDSADEAADAYNEAAKRLHGEFACLS